MLRDISKVTRFRTEWIWFRTDMMRCRNEGGAEAIDALTDIGDALTDAHSNRGARQDASKLYCSAYAVFSQKVFAEDAESRYESLKAMVRGLIT